MKRVIVAIPHSHTWFWTQTCVAALMKCPPRAEGCRCDVIVVDNSPWSPAIRGITETSLYQGVTYVIDNYKTNKFHASALDSVVERFNFDYLMAWETDVLALRPDWLQWFVDQMKVTDYAVGMWHHEQFVNPSCTLYKERVLQQMALWCRSHPSPNELRWGIEFSNSAPLDPSLNLQLTGNQHDDMKIHEMREWIAGPFAEKRGWPRGTLLKEAPSGQLKGPGWYEPGQQLHHWAVEAGYTYTVCPNITVKREDGLPLQSVYGPCGDLALERDVVPGKQLEAHELVGNGMTAHLWGGTRALDVLKHPVTCQFVRGNTPMWLEREARFWRAVVSQDVQEQTLELIRKYGWHITGQGTDHVSDRDREAAEYVRECYARGGVTW